MAWFAQHWFIIFLYWMLCATSRSSGGLHGLQNHTKASVLYRTELWHENRLMTVRQLASPQQMVVNFQCASVNFLKGYNTPPVH